MASKVEQMDQMLSVFADLVMTKERAANRATEIAQAELEVVKEMHNRFSGIISARYGIDPAKQRLMINYKDKTIMIEDLTGE